MVLNKKFSKTARAGLFLKGFARERKRQLVYAQEVRRPIVGSGIKKAGRGRPKGSYDRRYSQYGGVYGFRKILSQRLREQRLNAMRAAAVNPRQQAIIAQIEARDRARFSSPENQVIPDTGGFVPTKSVHQEIDEYSNLVP